MSFVGLAVAIALLALVPRQPFTTPAKDKSAVKSRDGSGFGLLFFIGALDTATRMGYLLFLPFLLHARGGAETVRSGSRAALIGGALGKAACGWLGQHLGVVWSVIATEAATALLMIATLMLPLAPILAVLPFLASSLTVLRRYCMEPSRALRQKATSAVDSRCSTQASSAPAGWPDRLRPDRRSF